MTIIYFYMTSMLPYMLLSLPILFMLRMIALPRLNHQGKITTPGHEIGWMLFSLFLVGLISQTIPLETFKNLMTLNIQGPISPIPFDGILEITDKAVSYGRYGIFISNIIGNIAIFAPIGFFIPLLWKKLSSCHATVLCGFGLSFMIEFLQLFSYRVTDIDDLLLNTLGAFLGWLAFRMVHYLIPRKAACFRLVYHEV